MLVPLVPVERVPGHHPGGERERERERERGREREGGDLV